MPHSAHRIAVVMNGNAKSVTADVIATLDEIIASGDLFVSRHIDEAAQIAETVVTRGYDTVLTGGGDGTFTVTVTEVVKAARRLGLPLPRFGLLKLGTGNALAWVVGASPGKAGLKADIARLHSETGSREIRLVDVEGYLTPFAGVGADAQVLADYNETKRSLAKTPLSPVAAGLFGYATAAVTRSLPGYLLRPMPRIRVVNQGDEAYFVLPGGKLSERTLPRGAVLFEGPARIAALSTIPYYGFALRMFPYADLRPDRMQLRISRIGSVEFVKHLGDVWQGTYQNPDTISDFLVEKVSIECEPPTDFQLGGDPRGKRRLVEASVSEMPIRLVDYYARPPI